MRMPASFACLISAWLAVAAVAADRVAVRVPDDLAKALASGPTSGRMVVFLKSDRCREPGDPADGPFFSDPQPIFSVAVPALRIGSTVELAADAAHWLGPLDTLDGGFRAQAVFKRSRDEGGVRAPGNLLSAPVEVTLHRD
ncbi:MAG: hypothetical protein ACKPEA_04515, partial [Planctomycetota bacterium]